MTGTNCVQFFFSRFFQVLSPQVMVNSMSGKAWELYIKVSDGEQYVK